LLKRTGWLYLGALVLGAGIWMIIVFLSGRREAWDSSLYFSLAMPLVCVGSLVLAMLEPVQSWRWGVIPFAGQFIAMLMSEGVGNLLPLGIIAFAIFSLPAIVAARIGAFLSYRMFSRRRS
jgi:hypothetical protein